MGGELAHLDKEKIASTRRRLIIGMVISVAFVIAEAVTGVFLGSLSLVSDAGHNAADTFAMGLALFAVFMLTKEPTARRTYGYGRVGILTALANAVGLVVVAGVLVYEAVHRMIHIEAVSGTAIMIVAGAAFLMNSAVAMLLFGHRHDLNVKSAFLHMLADAGISLGVVLAGAVIAITGWYYADPLAAVLVSLFILYAAWGLIREATGVLLESVPSHIDLDQVRETISDVDGVESVHHIHIWELGSGVYALSCHVEVEDRKISDCSGILQDINQVLRQRFNIVHPTIQMECARRLPGECEDRSSNAADPEGRKVGWSKDGDATG